MTLFADLRFRYPFRKYQRMVLETIVPENTDDKYHIVAPPGSGKTIIGLELVRRFGQPAVIFAPTTTIQLQWQEKLGLFTTDEARLGQLASTDPRDLKPINIFTYQLISAPAAAKGHLYDLAEQLWLQDLVDEGRAADLDEARQRLRELKEGNPRLFRRERARRVQRSKRRLLRDPDVDLASLLHPNARRLIDDLAAYGVRTVVLDECHHLLDYWAIVLRYLLQRLEQPRVIGLTATLPSPDGDEEFENYDALLGEVDFEVPTPAVVKEGDLAPYRDLALFVKPTPQEMDYLKHISDRFAEALSLLTADPAFADWVQAQVAAPPDLTAWQERWNKRPLLMLAAARYALSQGWTPPPDYPLPQEAQAEPVLEDWLALVEHYALDVLALSQREADHRQLQQLRDVLYGYGFTLTERGLRQTRSPGDMVLTFSESKDYGAALILEKEYAALGDRLRAVVVTDFERLNSGVRKLKGVLARDAGSAWRLFENLARNPNLSPLNPVLVTGRTVRCAAAQAEGLVASLNRRLAESGSPVRCRAEPEDEHVVRLVGEGGGWRPRVYVPLLTEAFNRGETKCLVGTRGILGEGWDAVKLNTLIDLTSVTTSTAVQQLRGRSLRKDPDWPHKVAHNWDVICVAPGFERGDLDFRRFLRRHSRYWGLMLFAKAKRENLWHPLHGRVVKGWPHVLPELFDWLHGFRRFDGLDKINAYMLAQIKRRDWVYRMWKVGEEYSNFTYRTTRLMARDLKIRTVFTLEKTVKRLLRNLALTAAEGAALFYLLAAQTAGAGLGAGWLLALVAAPLLGGLVFSLRALRRSFRALFLDQPTDVILGDVARATLAALREAGLVSRHLRDEFIRLYEDEEASYHVLVDYASPEDSDAFARALEDIFAPVVDQRYLILRTDERLPSWMLRPFWALLRRLLRRAQDYPPAYYPVPKALSRKKAFAEIFARHWAQYVGGGQLIYTRSEAGRLALLQARAQRRPPVREMAFEFWR